MIIPADFAIDKSLEKDDLELLEKQEELEEVLFEKTSYFNNISVVENYTGRYLKFDNSYQAGILNCESGKINLPYLNYFLLSPLLNSNIEKVLILGMGSGKIANDLLDKYPDIQTIDIVEIDPDVIDVAYDYFEFEKNEKINLYIQDAKIYIQNTDYLYDLIIIDIFSKEGMPYRFMTQEFMQEVNELLSQKGTLALNTFSSTNIDAKDNIIFKSFVKTIKTVFCDIAIFPTKQGNIELYNKVLGLNTEPCDLTNVVVFASKTYLEKRELYSRINNFKPLEKYSLDLYKNEMNLDNIKILKDEYLDDEKFNLENLRNYLKIDHKVNSVDPEIDEKKYENK